MTVGLQRPGAGEFEKTRGCYQQDDCPRNEVLGLWKLIVCTVIDHHPQIRDCHVLTRFRFSLLEASRAGADIFNSEGTFKYPSYVQDIMGDIFSLGFGPFRCMLSVVLLL